MSTPLIVGGTQTTNVLLKLLLLLGQLANLCSISQPGCRGHTEGVLGVHGKCEENQPRVKAADSFCGTFPGFPLSVGNPHPKRVIKILTHLNLFCLARQLELISFHRLLGMISAVVAIVSLGLLRAQPL